MSFQVVYGIYWRSALSYRILSYIDGPAYFYIGRLEKFIQYGFSYHFDQLLVSLRLIEKMKYISIGPMINRVYFNFDNLLYGPNPQIFVEGRVIYGNFFFLYYIGLALIFTALRKSTNNLYIFLILSLFYNSIFLDSQYAFNNVLDLLIFFIPLIIFKKMMSVERKIE